MTGKPRAFIDIHHEFEEIATRLVQLADELRSKGYSPIGATAKAMEIAHKDAHNQLTLERYGACVKAMGAFLNIYRGRIGEEDAFLKRASDLYEPTQH